MESVGPLIVGETTFSIEHDDASRTAIVRVKGSVTSALLSRAFHEACERFGVEHTNFFWDGREASFSDLSLAEIDIFKLERIDNSARRAAVRVAVLVTDEMSTGW
jgi:hypothetical protein